MTTELVPAVGALAPLDLASTKQSMQTYQEGLHALLDDSDWQTFTSHGKEQGFVKRSGWRKVATWFALNLEVKTIDIDRDTQDRPIRARVIARAIAPNGRYAEGDGACSVNERAFSKPEHDIPATATTRATNRAISNLVGMGAVSAEEVDGTEPISGANTATEEQIAAAAQAVQAVSASLDGFAFMRLLARTFDGNVPIAATRALTGLAWFAAQPIADDPKEQ